MEQTTQQGFALTTTRQGELAATSMAAKQKAIVEARFLVAMSPQCRRNLAQVRVDVLDLCKIKDFANEARYHKPVGKVKGVQQYADGFTIRFAESVIQALRNISTEVTTIWEDENTRLILISVTDLERNVSHSREVSLAKTVERRFLKEGQQALGERKNSYGDTVYIIEATDEEMRLKTNAAASMAIRDCGLRLVPKHILVEAELEIEKTKVAEVVRDPNAECNRICDAFRLVGVMPAELEEFLGHAMQSVSPKELVRLREVYTAIKEEGASWVDFVEEEKRAAVAKPATTPEVASPPPPAEPELPRRRSKPAPQTIDVTPEPESQPEPAPKPAQPAPAQNVLPMPPRDRPAGSRAAPAGPAEKDYSPGALDAFLARCGYSFDKLKHWCKVTGNDGGSDPDAWSSIEEIPLVVRSVILNSPEGFKNSIKHIKE